MAQTSFWRGVYATILVAFAMILLSIATEWFLIVIFKHSPTVLQSLKFLIPAILAFSLIAVAAQILLRNRKK